MVCFCVVVLLIVLILMFLCDVGFIVCVVCIVLSWYVIAYFRLRLVWCYWLLLWLIVVLLVCGC